MKFIIIGLNLFCETTSIILSVFLNFSKKFLDFIKSISIGFSIKTFLLFNNKSLAKSRCLFGSVTIIAALIVLSIKISSNLLVKFLILN